MCGAMTTNIKFVGSGVRHIIETVKLCWYNLKNTYHLYISQNTKLIEVDIGRWYPQSLYMYVYNNGVAVNVALPLHKHTIPFLLVKNNFLSY